MIRTYVKIFLLLLFHSFILQNAKAQRNEKQSILPSADTAVMPGEVTVSAYRLPGRILTTPGSISVLSGEGLQAPDHLSLAGAINTVPGVSVGSGTMITSRIVIRGMGSRTPYNTNRIRAYLNDIPLTTADGVSSPEEIDVSSIDRIEIIKGPGSALYGSGLGGSINIYTPRDTGNLLTAGAQYGSFNTGKFNIAGNLKSGKSAYHGSFSQLNTNGFRENNHYRRTSFIATSRHEYKKSSLNATLLFMNVKGGIPSSLGLTQFKNHPEQAATSWKAVGGYENYRKIMAGVSLNNNITLRITSQLLVFGKLNDNYEKRPFNNLDDMTLSGGIRYKISYQTRRIEWVAGGEWIPEQYKWKLDTSGVTINENSENRNQLNIFSLLNYLPVKKVKISAAAALNKIRYSLNDLFPADGDQSGKRSFPIIFSPRLGINYSPGGHFAVYASAGHGFSLPSPEETLLPSGTVNPDLKPEQGYQYETGIRMNFADNAISIDAALYRIDLRDLLVTKRISEDIFTGINAGRTKHQGFELLLKTRLFRYRSFPGSMSSVLSFTSAVNRFIDFTDNGIKYDGKYLPGIPRQTFQLQLRWDMSKMAGFYCRLQYTGNQYLTDDNTGDYPGYFLADAGISAKINLKKLAFGIFLQVNNMTDTHYASMLVPNAISTGNTEPRYYYPGQPLSINGGIQLTF